MKELVMCVNGLVFFKLIYLCLLAIDSCYNLVCVIYNINID